MSVCETTLSAITMLDAHHYTAVKTHGMSTTKDESSHNEC